MIAPWFLRCPYTDYTEVIAAAELEKNFMIYLIDNMPHSRKPFNPFFKEEQICAKCDVDFVGKEPRMRALGRLWHPNCFVCGVCKKGFTELFKYKDNQPFHIECLCSNCKKPFVGKEPRMSALQRYWHRHCFVCTLCQLPFTKSFATRRNKPYHVRCPAYNGAQAKALEDCTSNDSNMLSFAKGDILYMTDIRVNNEKGAETKLFLAYSHGNQGLVQTNLLEFTESESVDALKQPKDYSLLLEREDMILARAFAKSLPREEQTAMSTVLVKLMCDNGKILEFLQYLIRDEVNETIGEGTLFRSNTMITTLMTTYFHQSAKGFLKQLILPFIEEIAASPSLENDPQKITEKDINPEENTKRLYDIGTRFLNAIINSLDDWPQEVKNMCNVLAYEVSQKYPNSANPVVGGLVFLRGVAPSFVSPEGFGIVSTPVDVKTRRGLVLVSKLIQNVSNGKEFKENHMLPLNSFITDNKPVVNHFLEQMSCDQREVAMATDSTPLDATALEKLHLQISFKLSAIGKNVETLLQEQLDYHPFELLLSRMAELGPPKDSHKKK